MKVGVFLGLERGGAATVIGSRVGVVALELFLPQGL